MANKPQDTPKTAMEELRTAVVGADFHLTELIDFLEDMKEFRSWNDAAIVNARLKATLILIKTAGKAAKKMLKQTEEAANDWAK